ncbi:MAG: DUF6259 domain-containing protein [Planctomycetia bacterium]|nr:DUF6259 domain-containing protein [Planctomycetia bacterium]
MRFTMFIGVGLFVGMAWGEEVLQIQSQDLKMSGRVESHEKGAVFSLDSLVGLKSQASYLLPGKSWLFTIRVRETASGKDHYLNSLTPWGKIAIRRENAETIVRFENPVGVPQGEKLWVEILLTVSADQPGIQIDWRGRTESDSLAFCTGNLPLLFLGQFGEKLQLFYPAASGRIAEEPISNGFRWNSQYPRGITCSMSWFAVWDERNRGLYFAYEDAWGSHRQLVFRAISEEKGAKWYFEHFFENYGVGNNAISSSGKIRLQAFEGDWFDAAMLYKNWAKRNAKWWPECDANGRKDIPQWLKEQCAWVMASSDPRWLTVTRYTFTPLEDMPRVLREYADAVGVPVAMHWYLWHEGPYDNDFPHFFPAKEGFEKAVETIQEKGDLRVMPYTNGRLWDTRDRGLEDWKFSLEGKGGATKDEDGSVYTESHTSKEEDGSPCRLAVMCPVSEVWKNKVRENILTAMNLHQTQACYVDQVGAAESELCFDPTHGHPLGGGHWWVDAYREMFRRIRTDMRQEVSDIPFSPGCRQTLSEHPQRLAERIVTTESTGEPYIDSFDAFLSWHWNFPDQVPAFTAIYNQVIPCFGRAYRGDDLSFKSRTAQALAFGEQIGWFDPSVRNNEEIFPYIRDAIRFRWQIRDFFYQGEMCRPPRLEKVPKVRSIWKYWNDSIVTLDAVQSAVWRKQESPSVESVVIYFSNFTDNPVQGFVDAHLEELGLSGKNVTVYRVDADSTREISAGLEILDSELEFPANKSWGFLLKTPN